MTLIIASALASAVAFVVLDWLDRRRFRRTP